MSDEIQVTAIDVPADFDPSQVDYSYDRSSGAVMQPGAVATIHTVEGEVAEVVNAVTEVETTAPATEAVAPVADPAAEAGSLVSSEDPDAAPADVAPATEDVAAPEAPATK